MRTLTSICLLLACVLLYAGATEQLDLGRRMQADKLYDEALQQFSIVVSTSPASDEAEEALLRSGEIERTRGRFADAEAHYLRLWEGYPRSIRRGQALAGLAECRYRQGKYSEAAEDYGKLFQQYPMIDETRRAVALYVDSFYRLNEYQEVVLRGRDVLQGYPDAPALPEVMAIVARAYEQMNDPDRADELIARLGRDFPSTSARWEMAGMQAARTERKKGPEAAARQLRAALTSSTPRDIEESLREKIADWFIAAGLDSEAAGELEQISRRFTASPQLDRYVYKLTTVRLRLHQYREIVQAADSTLFANSSLRLAQRYQVGCARAGLNDWKGSYLDATQVLRQARGDSLRFATTLLLARSNEGLGRYRESIRLYQDTIRLYPTLADVPDLLRRIGDLWAESLDRPEEALGFYRQSASLSVNPDPRTLLATTRVLLQLGRIGDAGDELARLAPETITDPALRRQYADSRTLVSLLRPDPEAGLKRTVEALAHYADNNDRYRLQNELARIAAECNRDYTSALHILPTILDNIPLRAEYTLDLARIHRLQGRPDSASFYREQAVAIAAGITDSRVKAEFRVSLLRESDDPAYTAELLSLVQQYPDCRDLYKLEAARILSAQNRGADAQSCLRTLRNDGSVSTEDYLQTRLDLAEAEFRAGRPDAARPLFEEALPLLTLNRPSAAYHRLRCLSENSAVIPELTFLLDNAGSFPERREAVLWQAEMLTNAGRADDALTLLNDVPQTDRDPAFYRVQARLYRNNGNLQLAKEALMYIVDKDVPTLLELADLQLSTREYPMAVYSYNQLMSRDPANADRYRATLGHLAYIEDRYDDVVSLYQPLLAKSAPPLGIRESVIAYYRLGNRIKAEELRKTYKDVLQRDSRFLADVRLAEGVYSLKAMPQDAIDVFSDLIKDTKTPASVREQAYYWRGVTRQQQKDSNGAAADWTLAATSTNNRLACQAALKLGNLRFSEEKYDEALRDYDLVIVRDSTGILARDAAHNFALVCKTLNEWERAVSAYESMLKRWGDKDLQGETLFNIGYCYYRDKKYARAVDVFEKALPLLDNDQSKAEAMYWEAESFFGLEDWEAAVNAFLKVSYSYPQITQWAATAELRTADAYQRQGQTDKARFMLQRIITKYGAASMWGGQAQTTLKGME